MMLLAFVLILLYCNFVRKAELQEYCVVLTWRDYVRFNNYSTIPYNITIIFIFLISWALINMK